MQRRILNLSESANQLLAAFFFMDSTKEKEKALFAQPQRSEFFLRLWRSIPAPPFRNLLLPRASIRAKDLRASTALLPRWTASRHAGRDIPPGPVEQLLEMLKRISAVEPRIEHSVWNDKAGVTALCSARQVPKLLYCQIPCTRTASYCACRSLSHGTRRAE